MNVYWMENISEESREEISFHLEHKFYENNQILFRAGDYVDKIFFIGSGEVEIIVSLEDVDMVMETCGEG